MGIEPVKGPTHPPRLEAIEGTRRTRAGEDISGDRVEIGGERPEDEGGVRPAKVAEARLKIMNDYYSRRDIQRALAERLILELGA